MANRAHQLRLELRDQHLWDQLEEAAKQQCLALLSQLLQEIWREERPVGEEESHD